MSDYLFLYGTLLPNQAPSEVSALIRKLRKVGEGRVPGRLYDLGDYPGAVPDARSETNVTGEVFALPDGQSILPDLDSYEDFDPADRRTSLFVRERHPVMLSDGRRLECWVYVYNPALSRCKNTTLKINSLRLLLMICHTAKYGARLSLIAENQVVTLSRHLATLKGLVYNRNPGEAPLVVGGDYSKYKAA